MKLTGHKTEAVYRRYAIVAEADLADGVRKLAALHVVDAEARRVAADAEALALAASGTVLTQNEHWEALEAEGPLT